MISPKKKNLSQIPLWSDMKCLCETHDTGFRCLSCYEIDFACFVSIMLSGNSDC